MRILPVVFPGAPAVPFYPMLRSTRFPAVAALLPFLVTLVLAACDTKSGATTDATTPATEEALSAEDLISNPNTANPREVPVPNDLGVITFTEKEYNFGEIHQGEIVSHTFKFKNTGKRPVVIDNASSSCGCTVPTYPRDPVPPGAEGSLTVRFDSHGKSGQTNKVVVIRANTQPNVVDVTIKANVLVP